MSSRFNLAFIVVMLLGTLKASASEPSIILRLDSGELPPEAVKYIAEIGKPVPISVKAGVSLASTVIDLCGRHDGVYEKYVLDNKDKIGARIKTKNDASLFEADQKLDMPFCLKRKAKNQWPEVVRTSANTLKPDLFADYKFPESRGGWRGGDDASALYYAGHDYTSGKPFDYPSPWGSQSGQTLAYAPSDTVHNIELSQPESEPQHWASIPMKEGENPEKAAQGIQQRGVPAVLPTNTIRHLTTAEDDQCPPYSPEKSEYPAIAKYPLDVPEIVRTLMRNGSLKRFDKFAEVKLLIGDSGLYRSVSNDFYFFPYDTQHIPAGVEPNKDYRSKDHGTYVATAGLGGVAMMRFLRLVGNPIKLIPNNIVSKDNCVSGYCRIDSTKLTTELFDRAQSENVIVNLSISYGQPLTEFEWGLERDKNSLFVVAAGNDPKEVDKAAYPAFEAGVKYRNILAVAALGPDGRLSKQTSWSSRHVELAAYGCRIPVYQYKEKASGRPGQDYKSEEPFEVVRESGTSMAAPLVAFTAALLKTQDSGMRPEELRQRLIISADLDQGLKDKVSGGAKLNAVRALSLYHDAIEVEGLNNGAPIYGQLLTGETLQLCGGHDARNRDTLKRINIFKGRDGAKNVFYYYADQSDTRATSAPDVPCALNETIPNLGSLAEKELRFWDYDNQRELSFKMKDVVNLTFAWRPYWQN